MALWRLSHAALIGEVQTVVHCGNDLPICREIQRGAWRYAESQDWVVMKANGKESIEAHDGSRWLVRSQDGVYGWDAGLAVVDESWDVKPETITEGLEPAMLERLWAQLHLTSTAHRRATSLMKQRISNAVTKDDGETLLLLWAAPAGSDPGDPAVWKAASPHWSEDRRRMIAAKYEAAASGEADPELDDPDPMQGFTAQYLNIWQLKGSRKVVGEPLTQEASWEALGADLPNAEPDSVAVEGWNGEGLSVAAAWRVGDTVTVSVQDFTDLASAAAYVATFTLKRAVVVGAALAADPVWQGVRIKPAKSTVGAAVSDLSRLLNDGVIRHDGEAHLTHQVLNVRTSPSADGLRIRSTGRSDAIKAAVFAVQDARTKSKGKPRILTAP
jgi:phage terminase large subunit-like protein